MLDAGVTQEEARWLEQESARHSLEAETPRDQALAYCRALVGRYGGADALATLPVEDAGPCQDGTEPHNRHDTNVRYQIGKFAVCRRHAILRLRAQTPEPERKPERAPPRDLRAWVLANAHHHTTDEMRGLLRDWHTDSDTLIELLDLHADTARKQAA